MKTRILALLALWAFVPAMAWAVAAPVSITAGTYVNAQLPLAWLDDPVASQWNIYVGGKIFAQPYRSQTSSSGVFRTYTLQPMAPASAPWVITMRAIAVGQPMSAESAAITATASTVPVTYVTNPPGVPLLVSGTTGGGGTASSVTVTSMPPVVQGGPWTVSGSVAVTNNEGLTITTSTGSPLYVSPAATGLFGGGTGGAVTQGSPWTVSGSVAVTNLDGLTQSAAVAAAALTGTSMMFNLRLVDQYDIDGAFPDQGWAGGDVMVPVWAQMGVSDGSDSYPVSGFWDSVGNTLVGVYAKQGSPFTVSGSVSVDNLSSLTITSLPAVTQGSPWTVSGSVAVTNNQGLSVTASQGSPWTVSGSVAVTNNQGLSVTASQGSPWTVSGSVAVTNNQGLSVTASQGSPWTVSGSVAVTNNQGLSVTASQGSPWTVSGSVQVFGNVSLNAGTDIIGRVGVSHTVSVQGSLTSAGNVSLNAGTSIIGRVGVSHTVSVQGSLTSAGNVSLNAGTAVIGNVGVTNTVATSTTITAIADPLSTTLSAGARALNSAITADYDINTKTSISRKGAETTNYFLSTSGTTTVTASGYNLLYAAIYASTVASSNVAFFDGAVTRVALPATTTFHYVWPRGVAFKSGMVVVVTGASFDGRVSFECDR